MVRVLRSLRPRGGDPAVSARSLFRFRSAFRRFEGAPNTITPIAHDHFERLRSALNCCDLLRGMLSDSQGPAAPMRASKTIWPT